MKRRLPGILILLALALGLALMFCRCTAQDRLNRLHKKHPELFTADTVYSTRTFTVPGISRDTTVPQNTDLSGLLAIFEAQGQKIDSLMKRRLVQQISNYILERPCLADTLKVPLENGGFVKVWQAGGQFNYQQRQRPGKITVQVPYNVYTAQITRHYKWPLLFIGLAIGWVSFFLVINYLKYKQTKT